MWYIFPQIQGLGLSETSRFYAIKNINEAEEFFFKRIPILGSQNWFIFCNEQTPECSDANKIFKSLTKLKSL